MATLLFWLWLWLGAAWAADRVDINVATVEELDTLPGIGPVKAAAIVAWRTDHGPFASPEALEAVPGIGPATLASLLPLVTAGAAAAPSQAPAPATTAPPPAPASATAAAVNINAADATALATMPGIGVTKAAAIVEDRAARGPFASCADLDRVPGIGPATIAALAGSCTTN
jgi:competence protein ComEA